MASREDVKAVALPHGDGWVRALGALALRTPVFLTLLVGVSLVVRTRILDAGFWIDEGITVGISSFPLADIPGVLRQDGAPPLYYMLLHGWMALFGDGEVETHFLSLTFALLSIPAAYWAAGSIWGRREARIAAALTTVVPFLTAYGQETRMYSLLVLLALLATGAFVHAFVYDRRRYVPVFFALLIGLLYTHNWSIFFVLGAGAALAVCLPDLPARRRQLRDAALGTVAMAAAFAPWIPSLVFQALHTGAPWSSTPSASGLLGAPSALLHGSGAVTALLLAGGTGLAHVLRKHSPERTAVIAVITLGVATLVSAWLASQIAAAWANRYLAVVLGPLLLLAAVGLARAGRLGLVALALVLVFWAFYTGSDGKSNVRDVAGMTQGIVQPGDLVITTHPEQTPVLHYYLPERLRYATTLGPVADPRVMDWRDAVDRLEAAGPNQTLDRLLAAQPVGSRVLLVMPVLKPNEPRGWRAPWTQLVRERTLQWAQLMANDPRLRREGQFSSPGVDSFKPVRAVLYAKVPS